MNSRQPPSSGGGHVPPIVCYLDSDKFESHTMCALGSADHGGQSAVYQLGILGSAEMLIANRPMLASMAADNEDDVDVAEASVNTAINLLLNVNARVDRARWEATR